MNIKSIVLFGLSLTLTTGCSTTLTNEAKRLTVTNNSVEALRSCELLGFVEGSGTPWGGPEGLNIALTEAKNKAGLIPTADTLLITSSNENPVATIAAKVFKCSPDNHSGYQMESEYEYDDEVIAKAKECQSDGGVWVNDRCVFH